MELTARIHVEEGSYWADVPELPGCFASGDTLDDLFESLQAGVALYLADVLFEPWQPVRKRIPFWIICPRIGWTRRWRRLRLWKAAIPRWRRSSPATARGA